MLSNTPNLKNKTKTHKEKKPQYIPRAKITEKDIQEHKNFVADLKNALWHKVGY